MPNPMLPFGHGYKLYAMEYGFPWITIVSDHLAETDPPTVA